MRVANCANASQRVMLSAAKHLQLVHRSMSWRFFAALRMTGGQTGLRLASQIPRCLAGLLLLTGVATAADRPRRPPERPSGSFFLKAKRVYTAWPEPAPALFEPGIVIVRDGKIVDVGADLAPPPDLPVIEFKDGTVTPGLVAAATSLGGSHTGDESIAAGYRAADAFDPYGDYSATLAGGVTTVHLNPGGHRLLTGQGAVVRLGGPASGRILREAADLTINLGEPAFRPPRDVTYQTPASSDVAIPPAVRQRPDSRLGQLAALEEALAAARGEDGDLHRRALAEAWRRNRHLRIQVDRGADISAALRFIESHHRRGYLVGGAEVGVVSDELAKARVPVVYTLRGGFRRVPADLGYDPEALDEDLRAIGELPPAMLALSGPVGGQVADLRVAAAAALRTGFTKRQVLDSLTRIPAEILGVSGRVGRIAAGLDADLVVLSGDVLDTSAHAMLVYIGGEVAFEAPNVSALVVKAGTIWVDENTQIRDGAILLEDGKVSAVGSRVPHPPFARVIEAGPQGFITPGWIDAFGHLGFDGDRAATDPELSPAVLAGVPDEPQRRVALAGITTVLTAPYAASGQGSQVAAIRTAGDGRAVFVVRETAAVYFDFRAADPLDVRERLEKRLKAGKEYLEKWQKYEKELAEWKEKKAKGESPVAKPADEAVKETEQKADRITGTWEVILSGGPIPEPQTATMKLRLSGSDIEGRIRVPGQAEEAKVKATFDGKHISGTIEVETPFGPPGIEADLVEEDHIKGVVTVAEIKIDLDARRTDKSEVEFTVARRKTRGKHGEPLPPPIDEGLEPLKAVLEKKIPVVVRVSTEAQIAEALKIAKDFEAGIVLRDAEGATVHAQGIAERSGGVVLDGDVVRRMDDRWYHQGDDLSRKGVAIAFQSDAEDAARGLPRVGLHAVERGLSPDAALAAFTTDPSRMYKLDDKIGSLQPGRLGDLVIFQGHPFEAGSRIERVIINGEEVE